MIVVAKRRARKQYASVRLIKATETVRVPQTGAVGSVQEAEVRLPSEVLDEIWKPEYLERLARGYWRYLSHATLGLIRIDYTAESRAAVLLTRKLPLLRFHVPEYETSADEGTVTWRIQSGLLVAEEGRDSGGFLQIRVKRCGPVDPVASEQALNIHLEVKNFYPWLRGGGKFARFGAWLYGQTQLRIHVIICNFFLRSLARLDLPPSRVGALAGEIAPTPETAAEA